MAEKRVGRKKSVVICPLSPEFHFLAPSNWMNDPNGTIFYNGEYQLFYQHNPFKNKWGSIHWGHASSRDLIYWKHLPIALSPSRDKGEHHCFSGCCVIHNGKPALLYTKIGSLKDVFRGAEQWLAFGTNDMIKWEKFAHNPVMEDSIHGGLKVCQWRDPYLWKDKEMWYCVLSGHFKWKHRGVVLLYKSFDLEKWQFVGPLYQGVKGQGWTFECPNFFPLDNKYVLLISSFRNKVLCGIGEYRNFQFVQEEWTVFDHSKNFYATNTLKDDKGRLIVFGWIKGGGNGWNGCMSLPRILSLDKENHLKIEPLPELAALRADHIQLGAIFLKANANIPLEKVRGSCLEIKAAFSPNESAKFGILIQNCIKEVHIGFDGRDNTIFVGTEKGVVKASKESSEVVIHIFFDKSVIEVFVNYKSCITGHFYPILGKNPTYSLFAKRAGTMLKSLDVWTLNSIW